MKNNNIDITPFAWLRRFVLAAGVAAVSVAGIGCEEDEVGDATEDADAEVAEAAEDARGDLLGAAQEQADAAGESLAEVQDKAGEMANEMGVDLNDLDNVDFSALTGEQAQSMIEQLENLIGEGKIDQAKSLLAKLEGMDDKLPDSVKSRLEGVRTLLEKAESMGGAADALGDNAGGMLGGGK